MSLTVEKCREIVEAFKASAPAVAEEIYFRIGATQEELYGTAYSVDAVGVIFGGYQPGEHERGGHRYRGRCDLAAANLREPDHVLATLRHEVYGHYGLNTFERPGKRALLGAIVGTRADPAFAEAWRRVDQAYPDRSELLRAEEVFCLFAERATPEQHDVAVAGPRAFAEACLARLRPLTASDVEALAAMVAVGLRDRSRRQVIFPSAPGLQFQREPGGHDGYAVRVTHEVIRELENRTAPWVQPLAPGERRMPYNPTTGKDYRGMNAMLLVMQGRADTRWLTRRQAEGQGARLREGERGRHVQLQFFAFTKPAPGPDASGEPATEQDGEPLKWTVDLARPRLTNFWVYNAEQFEGLPGPEPRTERDFEPHAQAEHLMDASGVEIRHAAGDAAHYDFRRDLIVLPDRARFASADSHLCAALHELGHATGHASRLGRDLAHPYGSDGYAREELRVVMASLMMGDHLGIGHEPGQHAAYIQSWIRILRNDPREIFRAAADAEKIAQFILQGRGRELVPAGPQPLQPTEPEVPVPVPDTARRYVAIPFREKEAAKVAAKLGGVPLKWDREAGAWWTTDTPAALAALGRWLQRATQREVPPDLEFGDVLRAAGFRLEGPAILDGRIHRVALLDDRRGELTGAYCGYVDGRPAGWHRDMSAGEAVTWTWSGAPGQLTEVDRRAQSAQALQRRAEHERRAEVIHAAVVARLEKLLSRSAPAPADHPYLVAKGVGPGNLRINRSGPVALPPGEPDSQRFSARGQLLVPYYDAAGQLMGVQSISGRAQGANKSLPKGGRLAGGMHLIGDPARDAGPILVVEGWATGKTLSEFTGIPVSVAFSATNVGPVAEALRARYPDRPLVIAGDNDHAKEGLTGPDGRPRGNPGRAAAETAAGKAGGSTLLPRFSAGSTGSDWNDLRREDLAAFESQVSAGLARAVAGHDIRQAARLEAGADSATPELAMRRTRSPTAGPMARAHPPGR